MIEYKHLRYEWNDRRSNSPGLTTIDHQDARQETYEALMEAIRSRIVAIEAEQEKTTKYGTLYLVKGELIGVNGVRISVITIWLERRADGKFQFITLMPD
jgi:hypothetical protein